MDLLHPLSERTRIPAPRRARREPDPGATTGPLSRPEPETPEAWAARHVFALCRLALGSIFGWAFLDKLLGLGHETPSSAAWLDGGSPTEGFLRNATEGPFAGAYRAIAGDAWVDWLFMLGLAGIGTALLLGVTMRLAAGTGALLLVLMWSAVLPPANHVFMDAHLVQALLLVGLALVHAGRTLGLGRGWESLPVVRRHPTLW